MKRKWCQVYYDSTCSNWMYAPPKTNMVHLKISSLKGKNIYKKHQVLGFHVSFQGCIFLDHLFPIVFVKPHLPGHLCEEDLACSESNASRAWKRGDGGNVPVILCGNSHGPRSWKDSWDVKCQRQMYIDWTTGVFVFDISDIQRCWFSWELQVHCKLIVSPRWLNIKRFSQ